MASAGVDVSRVGHQREDLPGVSWQVLAGVIGWFVEKKGDRELQAAKTKMTAVRKPKFH